MQLPSVLQYNYYDSPEGQDVGLKTIACSKYALTGGLALSYLDVLLYSHPKGLGATLRRVAYLTGPPVTMAIAFTVVSNGLLNMRLKNDKWNYFYGGVASGAVLGACLRSGLGGTAAAIVLGAFAVVKKTSIEEGWVFFPDVPRWHHGAVLRKDYSWAPSLEKNYTLEYMKPPKN